MLAYLSDIFDTLNNLNLKLQGGDSNIVKHRDAINMHIEKLRLWNRNISANPCNYSKFQKVSSLLDQEGFEEVEEADFHNQISNFNTMDENIYRLSTDPYNVE
uniref:Uncharacterized protein n=1 Tax=Cacopsylla melanoneura TaxID=428564 RepID=A0A8D8L931_9HEMI